MFVLHELYSWYLHVCSCLSLPHIPCYGWSVICDCDLSLPCIHATMSPYIVWPLTVRTSQSDYATFNQIKSFFNIRGPEIMNFWVLSQTQNKALWLTACKHVSASSQLLRFILIMRLYSSFITSGQVAYGKRKNSMWFSIYAFIAEQRWILAKKNGKCCYKISDPNLKWFRL